MVIVIADESMCEDNRELTNGRLPLPCTHPPVFGNVSQRQIQKLHRGIVIREMVAGLDDFSKLQLQALALVV
jgi:hypothetical protein